MTARFWLLGADDPEMRAIEALLQECEEWWAHALDANGARVAPLGAYSAVGPWPGVGTETTYLVECAWGGVVSLPDAHGRVVQIDHHRPRDVGYGRPPAEFLPASSVGQVVAELARLERLPMTWRRAPPIVIRTPVGLTSSEIRIPRPGEFREGWVQSPGLWEVAGRPAFGLVSVEVPASLILTAAADHCLGAAYAGKCPGVDPADLLDFRVRQRAQERWRQAGGELGTFRLDEWVRRVRYDVETTREAVGTASDLCLHGSGAGPYVRDMRRAEPWPELSEAARSIGVGYVAGPIPESLGRRKLVCSGSTAQVAAFIRTWAPAQGLIDVSGDPEHGFAGGYLP